MVCLLLIPILGFIYPMSAVCIASDLIRFNELSDTMPLHNRIKFQRSLNSQARFELTNKVTAAKNRIGNFLDTPVAEPEIIFASKQKLLGFMKVASVGTTISLPYKTCTIFGYRGRSVDVIAHELMHAELINTMGYIQTLTNIPTWFDEGLAMQVDFRTKYNPSALNRNPAYVKTKTSQRLFWDGSAAEVTENYSAAKAIVSFWLKSRKVTSMKELKYELERGL